ncbi:MAG: RNA-binding protein [Treponema sp.]|nr:RNA-binding protein [Treponema sp.]
MAKKLYVGNLSYSTTEESLNGLFAQFGEVVSAIVIKDRATGQSKGFGFVELADEAAADKAIEAQNGKEFEGRRIRVNVAEERKPRPPRFTNDQRFRG